MTASERIYRLLLKSYPLSFRREYEQPMLQHFRDQLRAATQTKQRIRFWMRILIDLMQTAPRQHSPFTRECRLAIFFARFEASSFSRPEITLEHLLLGLLRSDTALRSTVSGDAVRQIEASEAMPRRVSRTGDLPLDDNCRRAIQMALREAQANGQRVTARHLLNAIRQQEETLAASLLQRFGQRRNHFE